MTHTIIKLDPVVRINDLFVTNGNVNASPVCKNVAHPLISSASHFNWYQANFYKFFACDIVSETVFNYPYSYITEKSLRPLACKRMFIILGAKGTLGLLREKGFLTFGDFIDESYDSINDHEERFFAVVNEIKKICAMPLDTVKNYIKSNSDKFEHNFLTLKTLQELELQQISKRFNIDYD